MRGGDTSTPPAARTTASSPVILDAAAGYRRWADSYDQLPNPLLACEERYLVPRLPDLRNRRALDVACGTGRWLPRFLHLGAVAVGVDISYPMLWRASQKGPLNGKLVQADCLRLPIRSNCIDFAILAFALSHLDKLDCFFQEMSRLLKTGGTLIITDLHPAAYARGWRTGFKDQEGAALIHSQPHFVETIARAASRTGFEVKSHADLCIESSEKPSFEIAGELDRYHRVLGSTAVLALELERT